jgi:hypothetical protein
MNPEHHYQRLLDDIVATFNTLDMAAIMAWFTDDVVVRYNDIVLEGAGSLEAFLRPRYADLQDYRLDKRLRTVSGTTIGVEAQARFIQRSSGCHCTARIHEFLVFDGARIRQWDYVGHLVQANAFT